MMKKIKKIISYSILGSISVAIMWAIFLFFMNSFGYSNEIVSMPNGKTIVFLNADEAYKYIIDNRLIDNFSKLDIELRLEKEMSDKDLETCKKEYRLFLKNQILNWKGVDKRFAIKRITKAYEMIEEVSPAILQDTVYMILATGKQEFGAFYTLQDAIVCPKGKMRLSSVYLPFLGSLKKYYTRTFVHELFHIYSTNNPYKREKLYKEIGFEPIDSLKLSPKITSKLIYNPDDKPGFYKINLTEKNTNSKHDYCMQILSKYPTWQGYIIFPARISVLIVYVESYLHKIEFRDGNWVSVFDEDGKPIIKQKSDFIDLYKKIGYDSYSPEEIVAHLFIEMVLSEFDEHVLEDKSKNYKNLLNNLKEIINN